MMFALGFISGVLLSIVLVLTDILLKDRKEKTMLEYLEEKAKSEFEEPPKHQRAEILFPLSDDAVAEDLKHKRDVEDGRIQEL